MVKHLLQNYYVPNINNPRYLYYEYVYGGRIYWISFDIPLAANPIMVMDEDKRKVIKQLSLNLFIQ